MQEIAERIEYIIIVIFVIVRHAAPSEYRTEKEWHARGRLWDEENGVSIYRDI